MNGAIITPETRETFSDVMRKVTHSGYGIVRSLISGEAAEVLAAEAAQHSHDRLSYKDDIRQRGFLAIQRTLPERIGRNGKRSVPLITALGHETASLVRDNALGWPILKNYICNSEVLNFMDPEETLPVHCDPLFQSGVNIAVNLQGTGEFTLPWSEDRFKVEPGDAVMLLLHDTAKAINSAAIGSDMRLQNRSDVRHHEHAVRNSGEGRRLLMGIWQ